MALERDPVVVAGAIAALIESVLVLAITFGLEVSAEQLGAITVVIIGFGSTVASLVGRKRVTPVSSPFNDEGQPLFPLGFEVDG